MNLREAVATFRGHRVPNINFIGRARWWFALSGVVIALSLVGLFVRNLNFSISFTGGALLSFENRSGASVEEYQGVMARFGRPEAQVEILGTDQVNIRTESLVAFGAEGPTPTGPVSPTSSPGASPTGSPPATPSPSPTGTASPEASPTAGATGTPASPGATPTAAPSPTPIATPVNSLAERLRAALARTAGISPDEINEQDVGPTWGSTISRKAITGLFVFLVLVSLYITLRFELRMAAGALVALVHDVVITAGIYALTAREVTPETVVAILTILGYSLYDTVVIYDKVKENTESAALVARDTYSGVVNASLNQVFMRSVNTSLVVLAPIGALLLFGGQTLKDFAFALFVGTAVGAYSSVFVAAPVLAILKEREPRYQQIRARAQARASRPGLRVAGTAPAERPVQGPTDRQLEPAGAAAAAAGSTREPVGSTTRPRTGSSASRKKKGRPQGKPKRRRR